MPNSLAFTPTLIMDEQKKSNELAHNQKQTVFPFQTDPNQVLPYVPPPPGGLGTIATGAAPESPMIPTAPAAPMPEPKAPTFDVAQAAALAQSPVPTITGEAPTAPPKGIPAPMEIAGPPTKPVTPAPLGAPAPVAAPPTPPVSPADVQPVPGGYQPQDLQRQVLQAGQQTVLEGFESPVTDLTSLLTQKLLQDPTFGREFKETMGRRMAGYDLGAAQAFEKSRQATAPISQTGANIEDLQMLALSQGQDRARFGTELEEQEYNRMLQDTLSVLTAGREASEMERQRFETDVGSIAAMTGAAEGTEQRLFEAQENAISRGMEFALQSNDQTFQFALTELQGKMQQGIQLTAQDFHATQSALDRALDEAMQSNDIKAQENILSIKQDFQAQQDEIARMFMSSESALERLSQMEMQANDIEASEEIEKLRGKIQEGLQLTEQDFRKTESSLDRQLSEAMQTNDIAAQDKIIMAQLDMDKWKTEAGFAFSEEQNALNRGLELSLQSGDQAFKENMLGLKAQIDLNLMTTDQEWQGIQSDLDRQMQKAIADGNITLAMDLQKMQQEFQAVQNTQQQFHETNMQDMTFEQEKWKQGEIEKLTTLGWSHEDAMQQADQTHQKYMQDFEWKKKELMQEGMNEHDAEMMAQDYSYKEQMQTTEHIFQSQIEAGKITLEEKKLAQQATQFTSELEFQEWAKTQDIDLAEAQMAWQTSENAVKMAHEMKMQELEIEFAEKGMNLQLIMEEISGMPPDQAAAAFNQIAADAGFTYQDTVEKSVLFADVKNNYDLLDPGAKEKWLADAEAQGISAEDANSLWDAKVKGYINDPHTEISVTKAGLKPSSAAAQAQFEADVSMEGIYAKLDENVQLTPEEYETYKTEGTHKPVPFKGRIYEWTTDARGSNTGYRAWRFTNAAWTWLEENKGGIIMGSNGELYRISSYWEPGESIDDKKKKAFVSLESIKDGSIVNWNRWEGDGDPLYEQ